jgi:outer membrane protein assembly factor BamB
VSWHAEIQINLDSRYFAPVFDGKSSRLMEQTSTMRNLDAFIFSAFAALAAPPSSTTASDLWPQWRGVSQNGAAVGEEFPIRWSESSGIAWKTELPGNGGSTPVIRGTTAYLTSGVDGENMLLAFNIEDGSLKWQTALGSDRGNKHRKGSGSNPSAVIDGDSIFAYFRSGDLACVDSEGNVRWKTNLQDRYGGDTLWWDLGSSPLLTKTAIVVAVMQTGPSYLVAFEKESGQQLWISDRSLGAPEEAAQCYSTPLAVTVNGQDAVAVMGADHLTLHHAADGSELGRLGGFNPDGEKFFRSISSPVAEEKFVVCPYARGATVTGVNMNQLADGKGEDAIAWFRDDLGSDVPTPAALEGRVYVVGDGKRAKGKISCLDIETGRTIWTQQLPKSRGSISFSSSPLVAGNHLYVTQENATTFVIGPLSDPEPEIVSENRIEDDDLYTVASLVPVGDTLLLRSRHHLYRITGQ